MGCSGIWKSCDHRQASAEQAVPDAVSVDCVDQQRAGQYTLSPLMHSSNDSYGETNINGLLQNETNNDQGVDIQGPVEIGYAADTKDGKPKAVILGSSISCKIRKLQMVAIGILF